jgi:formylglycine-generating enzyme required for sulfatase activity
MATVFISHAAKEDAQFAHRLADDLRRLGLPVWIAPESIRPGEGWVRAIERGLAESSHVVVVLTPAALESKWVEKETDVAIARERQGRIQVIPLELEPCRVPLLLSSYQMVSFRRDYEAGLSQLAGILGVRVPPPEPVRPLGHAPLHGPMPEVEEEVPIAAEAVAEEEPPQPFEPEMVLIPAGQFLMGSDPKKDKYARDHEQPQHTLHLPDYYLARTPLTNAQYAAFVQATGHWQPWYWQGGKPPKGKEDHPVVWVSWQDAVAYCRWLAEVTGRPYRLPSEAEWEKGARGSDGRLYPWGNRWDAERCNSAEGGEGDTTPVGAYPQGASPYGLLDMAGNVWEWTCSLWGEDGEEPSFKYPYDPADGRQELEAPDSVLRVLRGGSWNHHRDGARCVVRYWSDPVYSDYDFGFRLVSPVGSGF